MTAILYRQGDELMVSDEARQLYRAELDLRQHFEETASFRPWAEAFESLSCAYDECSQDNWDGEGARGIRREAYCEAARLLEELCLLPYPPPEIVPEPSGAIGLEWRSAPGRALVFALAGDGKIEYAGLLGTRAATHGSESCEENLPRVMLEHLRRLHV